MKIVKFHDGFYGIRKWGLFQFCWLFLDFDSRYAWRKLKSEYFMYCRRDDLALVKKRMASIKDKGTFLAEGYE